jgi:regulator of protease activity HflC (stomatin/prohibitin superfamily)
MFDKLIDLCIQFIELFRFFIVIDQFERGVVLRLGVFNRELEPGFHFLIPFNIENCMTDNVVTRVSGTSNQVLTTKDEKGIIARVMVRWRIRDIQKALLEVEGVDDAFRDSVFAVVKQEVHSSDWATIRGEAFGEELTKKARKLGFRYGIEVEQVQFTDLAISKSFTLNNN